MRKLVVSEFVTVDGVMQDPGGAEGFERGGWALQFDRGLEGDKFKLDELMASDALLLGRTTYEGFAAAWPSRTGEFADKMNGMAKYVVSSTLEKVEWNNSTTDQEQYPRRNIQAESDGGRRHPGRRQRSACTYVDAARPRRSISADGLSDHPGEGKAFVH